jgi:hypothetical protein
MFQNIAVSMHEKAQLWTAMHPRLCPLLQRAMLQQLLAASNTPLGKVGIIYPAADTHTMAPLFLPVPMSRSFHIILHQETNNPDTKVARVHCKTERICYRQMHCIAMYSRNLIAVDNIENP